AVSAYLLDRESGAIAAEDGPLYTAVGPRAVVPIDDVIAALVAGPRLARDGVLATELIARRFAPRADEAVALAVAELPAAAQEAALEMLFSDPGPDAELL